MSPDQPLCTSCGKPVAGLIVSTPEGKRHLSCEGFAPLPTSGRKLGSPRG